MPIDPNRQRQIDDRFRAREDAQRAQFAEVYADADRVGARYGCGQVVEVFRERTEREARRGAPLLAIGPVLAGIPVLIALAEYDVPGAVHLLGLWPFMGGAWAGMVAVRYRTPRRTVWLYAFTDGFLLLDGDAFPRVPVRWRDVRGVMPEYADDYDFVAEETRQAHVGYRVDVADGSVRVVSRGLKNVADPCSAVGPILRNLIPRAAAGAAPPAFTTVDDLFAGRCPPP